MTFEELLEQIKTDYLNPAMLPDGTKIADRNGHTRLADLQEKYNLSSLKIQKLLVTAGVFEPVKTTSSYYQIKKLYDAGTSAIEIMATTGLSSAVVNASIPYERGAKERDKLGVEITNDATRKRRQRSHEEMKKENALSILGSNITDDAFWNALQEHEQEVFITAEGERYYIEVGKGRNISDEKTDFMYAHGNELLRFSKTEVLDVLHQVLDKQLTITTRASSYVLPILIYFDIVEGDKKKVIVKRNPKEARFCACCGRTGAGLYQVSSFDDLIILENKFRAEQRASWTEEERKNADLAEKMMATEREKNAQRVEAAKSSKIVEAFNAEGERQFCQLCAETIYHALADGDAPFVSTKSNFRNLPLDIAQKFLDDQLIETTEVWEDENGHKYDDMDLYKAVDINGAEHYFILCHREMGALLSFEALEVHRLTKAGKHAVNNTDTFYGFQHLIELYAGDDKEQRICIGLMELMEKIKDALQNPTLERGYLRTTGTIIPTFVGNKDSWSGGEYGFKIDGKIYSGEQLAKMASNTEGWQIQFQVKDPSEDILKSNEYLMPMRLGEKDLVNDTLELLRLFTEDGRFISDHDEENFSYLFEKDVLPKLKLYHESNPRGYGKLAGMGIIRVLGWYEGTDYEIMQVRQIIR